MTLTIGKKISLAFTAILTLIFAMGIIIYRLNSNIQVVAKEIQQDDVPGVILYLQLLDEIGDMHRNVVEYSNGEMNRLEEFQSNLHEFQNFFAQLKPLEISSTEDKQKVEKIERLMGEYINDVKHNVFDVYDPLNERWSLQTIEELERNQGAELQQLLSTLKEQEFNDSLKTLSIEEAIKDGLPGIRYYLELIDLTGDMFASLNGYVEGKHEQKKIFKTNAENFTHYFNLLSPLEQKPNEIRDLITINRLYSDIVRTADTIFRKYNPEGKKNGLKVVDRLEQTTFKEMEKILDSSSLEEQDDSNMALLGLSETLDTVNEIVISITVISLLIGLIISYWITKTILRAVGGEPDVIAKLANEVSLGNIILTLDNKHNEATGIYAALINMIEALKIKIKMTEQITQGDLSSRIELASDNDTLGIALNKMQLNFKEMVEQANAFAAGDYSSQITPRSKQDEFGIALSHMMKQVTDRNNQVEAQNWLKTQVMKVSKLSQGIDDIQLMTEQLISELASTLQAGHATFYLLEEQQTKTEVRYQLRASYGYKERKHIANNYALGEGLVGQCALEKQNILLTNVPTDYIKINSGLGEQTPLNILLLPILFEGSTLAVIEIASFNPFNEIQLEFLNQAMTNLGITINSLISRKRVVQLLEQSQSQTEELQSQTEELQSQSEELRATNEELEQKANTLNRQSNALQNANADLEAKTKDLEIKQKDIEIKNQQIEEKAKELAIASKYKSEFLANMSHELRTPLNSLLLLAKGLANNKEGNLTPVQVEDARVIFDGGNSLLTLINDIMDLSKVEAGKLTIHDEPVSLERLSSNLDKMFSPLAKERNLAFSIQIDEKIAKVFKSDSLRVEQILRNLLSNAIKFTPHGSVTLSIYKPPLETHFTHSDLNALTSIAFSVIDTGIGIPDDKQIAIFEAFQQEDGTTSRKYGGTGLGLTIARELSRLLGGEIHLKSELGVGSTFTLYLSDIINESTPKGPISHTLTSHNETTTQKQTTSMITQLPLDDRHLIKQGDSTLLIIEDDDNSLKLIQKLANQYNYKHLVTHNTISAVALAKQYHPNGIILNIDLPDIDGCQIIAQLKRDAITSNIPIQVISSYSEQKNKILGLGAMGFIKKPINETQLNAIFTRIQKITDNHVRRVLLIEDDKSNQKATTQLLENEYIKITSVGTAKAGIAQIETGLYDVIILDIGLPDMSGFELLNIISESAQENTPPIIIYTGREISPQEQKHLDQYSASIVLKGANSAERLEDDIALFLHKKNTMHEKEVNLIHNESAIFNLSKVLLVDDDMRNCYALSKRLIELGMTVELAENGQEALNALAQQHDFNLILMDTMMPVMDGNKATELIRQIPEYKNVPIIALTAKTMPEDKEKCLLAGASEYITKPIDFEKLISIMRIWLFAHK